MAQNPHHFKLGLFVLTATAIFVGALFVLGGSRLFRSTLPVVTLFKESVQGLEEGSPVKMRGVPIGRVGRIHLRQADSLIEVEMKLFVDRLDAADRTAARLWLLGEMRKGATCRLEFDGITGAKYIEIDYGANGLQVPDPPLATLSGDALYLPATRSVLTNISRSITTTLDQLANVPYAELARKLDATLAAAEEMLRDNQLQATATEGQKLMQRLGSFIDNLEGQVGDDDLRLAMTAFREAAEELRLGVRATAGEVEAARLAETTAALRATLERGQAILGNVEEAKLGETAAAVRQALDRGQTSLQELDATLLRYRQVAEAADEALRQAQFPATAADTRQFLGEATQTARSLALLQRDVRLALAQLQATLVTVQEWVRYLDEDPAALLRGKAEPPAPKEKSP